MGVGMKRQGASREDTIIFFTYVAQTGACMHTYTNAWVHSAPQSN